ncbi:hypothetical protein ZEAMMB73_Zm00001d013321 [Zea mays]|uniref:Uncharacterized protein n=1 Tax=Zea mays TaxID=4577 RepID=A0A1D6GI51_MAIZE|nr:hypothetical protein ZEAMMB73_Zm00001d013321 [Zea mays]
MSVLCTSKLLLDQVWTSVMEETQLLHPGFTACIAYQNTDLTVSCGTLQVMYDAFGVRLHAGKQAEVQSFVPVVLLLPNHAGKQAEDQKVDEAILEVLDLRWYVIGL